MPSTAWKEVVAPDEAARHAAAASALGHRVVAVASHRLEGARAFAERHAAEAAYRSVDELVAAGGIDGLIVCTPNALHAPDAIAALEAGIPALVEKPMAMNAAEAESMQRAAERSASATVRLYLTGSIGMSSSIHRSPQSG